MSARATLDPASREALRGFATRLSLLGLLGLVPMLAGDRAVEASRGCLAVSFSMGCMVNLGRAIGRGQRVGIGPLNCWDEALAFAALSRLAHMGM